MRWALALAVAGGVSPAVAQQSSVTTMAPDVKSGTVKQLLSDGFEVKAGFSDNNGGAYLVLQKATAAFLCRSGASLPCEKLN